MRSVLRLLITALCLAGFGTVSCQVSKVYLHTDRTFCFTGDSIRFEGYLVSGNNKLYTSANDTLFIRVIDQFGLVVAMSDYPVSGRPVSGFVHLPESLNEGNYILVAYTASMKKFPSEKMFSRIIAVQKPADNYLTTELSLSDSIYQPGGTLIAQVRFTDNNNSPVPAAFSYQLSGRNEDLISGNGKANNEGTVQLKLQLPKFDSRETMELTIDPTFKGAKYNTGVIIPTKFNYEGTNTDQKRERSALIPGQLNVMVNPAAMATDSGGEDSFEIYVTDEMGEPVVANLSISAGYVHPHLPGNNFETIIEYLGRMNENPQLVSFSDLNNYFAQYLLLFTKLPGRPYILTEKNNIRKLGRKSSPVNKSKSGLPSDESLPAPADRSGILFWNSNILTDNSGKASVKFMEKGRSGEIQVSVDAVGTNGAIGSGSFRYSVK